jgi:excisionase family DNA binding protein
MMGRMGREAVKRVLSTTEAARLLRVAVKSVQNWIDQGRLRAGRTPGGHRRIDAQDLVVFLNEQNLSVPKELTLSSPRVLVVDDEPGVTDWIAGEIKARHPDWEVVEAHDGFSAGELVEAAKPDVVILDLRMPGLDGHEVCRRIKGKDNPNGTAIIAITAYPSPKTERAILECGARVCLSKPLDSDTLMGEVEEALRKHV